jgi:hypothetical protein
MARPKQPEKASVVRRQEQAFRAAIQEARDLMDRGHHIRISQAGETQFKVYGRKSVVR